MSEKFQASLNLPAGPKLELLSMEGTEALSKIGRAHV